MEIKDTIKTLRETHNLSQDDLGKIAGVSGKAVSTWEKGTRIPRMGAIQRLADYFNIKKSDIIGDTEFSLDTQFDNIFPIELKKFPLLGDIACGEPIFCNEDRESYILAGSDIRADFCLKCKGDSMINARIYDGDIVFIRKQDSVENGEIAAVVIDDEATLKRMFYYPENNMVILKPENTTYKDIVLVNDQLNSVHILGKAVAFQSDVR